MGGRDDVPAADVDVAAPVELPAATGDAAAGGGAAEGGAPLFPPVGRTVVVWSIDVRRFDADATYRREVTEFVYSRVPGAALRSARVLQDDSGALMFAADTALHADGSFRGRRADGGMVRAPVVIPLPADVDLPS